MSTPTVVSVRERWTTVAVRVWAIVGVMLLIAAAGWLFLALFPALVPFGIGLLIVLLLRRPVAVLSKRMPRVAAVLLCYLATVLVVALALTFIIPPVVAQVGQFLQAVPGYAQQAFKLWDAYFVHPKQGAGAPAWLETMVVALKTQVIAGAGSWSAAIAQGALSAGASLASGLVAIGLAFLIGFYTLVDLPRLEREVFLLAGDRARAELAHALRTVARVLEGWIRGTLIRSTVMAVLSFVGLAIAGVPYALALGVIGGLFNVVPYVGPIAALLLAVGAGLFVSPWTALWALLIVLAIQQLDGFVMAPRIMSDQLDLHPLLFILALTVGATLFGVVGLVLSIPVAAVVKGLFVYWFEKRTERQITDDEGALFRTSKRDDEEQAIDLGLEALETDSAAAAMDEDGHSRS
jgi:predicted PurR-regulated permease PerM